MSCTVVHTRPQAVLIFIHNQSYGAKKMKRSNMEVSHKKKK